MCIQAISNTNYVSNADNARPELSCKPNTIKLA